MGRNAIQIPSENWRERLFWISLAASLIALLLFSLVALAEWGERVESTPIARVTAQPGSTALMADLLIPPPAPPTPFMVPLPQLPAVGAAPIAGPDPSPECGREAVDLLGRPKPLFVLRGKLCAVDPPFEGRAEP